MKATTIINICIGKGIMTLVNHEILSIAVFNYLLLIMDSYSYIISLITSMNKNKMFIFIVWYYDL